MAAERDRSAATAAEPSPTTDPDGRPDRPLIVGRSSRRQDRAEQITAWLFLLPYLVLFAVFLVLPIGYGLWISLHNWNYLLPVHRFIGFQNYADLFHADSETAIFFWQSMKATGLFMVLSVPFLLVIPLLVALLLNQKFRGRGLFRSIFFAPYVLGVAVVGIMWRYLLDTHTGYLTHLLEQVGLPAGIPWTTGLPWAWVTLIGVTVWWTLGFNAVILLAGLQAINRDLYDAAAVDGAGRYGQFRHVTLPGLRPVMAFVITITIVAAGNMFGQSYLITQGSPGNATRTAIMYIANEGVQNFRMGSASAMSFVLFVFLALISLVGLRLTRYSDA